MPWRLNEFTAKVQFQTSARMPSLMYKACKVTGIPSNGRYASIAIAERLSRDLGIPLQELLDELPPTRSADRPIFGTTGDKARHNRRALPGPSGTIEDVK